MGLFGLGKKKDDGDAKNDASSAKASSGSGDIKLDAKKARKFFEHAHTVADAANYDYAIEMFTKGLANDIINEEEHEKLYEVAMKRKIKGGKPAGMMEQMKLGGGKNLAEKFSNSLTLLAKDPQNVDRLIGVMENIVPIHKYLEKENGISVRNVLKYYGKMALEINSGSDSPKSAPFIKIKELCIEVDEMVMARDSMQGALALDRQNMTLLRDLKNIEALITEQSGKYGDTQGSFRDSIRDADKQAELERSTSIAAGGSRQDQIIEDNKRAWEADKNDIDTMLKYVTSLLQGENKENEDKAIKVLEGGFERFGQYRLKVRIGDIRIKQMNRYIRQLNAKIKAEPNEASWKQKKKDFLAKKTQFELQEYTDRVKNYPTEMGLRYELGVRQFALQDFDNATKSFQDAQADTKVRSRALYYLGRCFMKKEWFDEGIQTFKRAIEAHPLDDDSLAKDLRYNLMDAYYQQGKGDNDLEAAQEAQAIASDLAQKDINFKDISDRMDEIRSLVKELK